jgi:RNA polymerase primary sigma factor
MNYLKEIQKDNLQVFRQIFLSFQSKPLHESASFLFHSLGYESSKRFNLPNFSPQNFKEFHSSESKELPPGLYFDEWLEFAPLFQYSEDELGQHISNCITKETIQSFVVLSISLKAVYYFPSVIDQIAKGINKFFPMPVISLISYGKYLSISLHDRRINLKDSSKDVLQDVASSHLIDTRKLKKIYGIFRSLSLPTILTNNNVKSIYDLYKGWVSVLKLQRVRRPIRYDGLVKYLEDIHNKLLLPDEPEERYVVENMRLVAHIVLKDFSRYQNEFQDLFTAGYEGLKTAIPKYQANKGAKFSTYSSYWIKQSIKRYLANNRATVRIPIQAQSKIWHIHDAMFDNSTNPTKPDFDIDNIASATGLSPRTIKQIMHAGHRKVLGICGASDLNRNYSIQKALFSVPTTYPVNDIEDNDPLRLLNDVEKYCTPKEAKILFMRYGLRGYKEHTLEEASLHFKKTRERIRQIENEALRKLKERIEDTRENLEQEPLNECLISISPTVMTPSKFKTDLMFEIYQLLEDNKVEMTFNEIVAELRRRFPKIQLIHKQIRNILRKKSFRNRLLCGSTALYSPEEWYH